MYEEILSAYSNDELLHICKYLNKDYNIYDTENMRWKKIKYAFYKTTNQELLILREKVNSNEFINYLFMRFYNCERVIKYHFIKHLKDAIHDIVAFEMSIGDSRIDICRINGKLCAYEIKTEYDKYDRLKTQMSDYLKAFEKVYVIVPAKNYEQVQNFIPLECGMGKVVLSSFSSASICFGGVISAKKEITGTTLSENSLNLFISDMQNSARRVDFVTYSLIVSVVLFSLVDL